MDIDVGAITDKIMQLGVTYLPKALLAIVVFIVGGFLIKKAVKLIKAGLLKGGIDETLTPFLAGIVGALLKVMLVISVISMFGVATTSFIAILGAAGLAVGMALQGTLGNFAGSVLLMIFKPYKIGDYIVVQDKEGFVKGIDIFTTQLTTLDNQRVIIPNGPLSGGTIVNISAEDMRRVDIAVGIGYSDDFPKTKKILLELAASDSRVLKTPEPFVGITGFGDSAVDLTYRLWCKTDDYWGVFFDFNEKTKACLDSNGISIPFPQRDVHMISGPQS